MFTLSKMWNSIYIIWICLIVNSICLIDDELDGHITFYIYHSLEPSNASPIYESRGTVVYYSNRNEAIYSDDSPLSSAKIEKLQKLAASDDIYRVKISSKPGDVESSSVFSFTKACGIYESGLTDILTVTLDQGGSPVGVAVAASPAHCMGEAVSDTRLLNFNTTVSIVSLVNGPSPDTLTYIQRLEQEKAEKARGEQGDNRSFLSKYWMYIVPFVIFLFISGASSPEGQAAGGR